MFKKVVAIGRISILTLAMTGLLVGCGSMVNLDSNTYINNNEVIESKEETKENKATEVEETESRVETLETKTESNLDEKATEVVETTDDEEVYIKYEDIEPVKMYVTFYCELYADFNVTGGEFQLEDDLIEGEVVLVDAKGTYEGNEFYRLVKPDNSIYPYHLVALAKTLTTENPADTTETKAEDLDPFFNGSSYSAPLIETEENYIKYEDIEPVKMYVTKFSDVYIDFNATKGEFMIGSYIYEGEDVNVNAKGTFKGVEYYRVVRPENSFSSYYLVVPAEALSLEKPATDSNTNANPAINENGGFTIG